MASDIVLRRLRWWTLALSIALFVAACATPALSYLVTEARPNGTPYRAVGDLRRYSGLDLLASGWLGPLTGEFTWLANPCLWWAWLFLALRQRGLALSGAVLALLFSLLLLLRVPLHEVSRSGSITYERAQVHIGYWLWLGSLAVACAGAALYYALDPRAPWHRAASAQVAGVTPSRQA